jgi:hypothetical protein
MYKKRLEDALNAAKAIQNGNERYKIMAIFIELFFYH